MAQPTQEQRLEALAAEYDATAQLIRDGKPEEYENNAKAIRTTLTLLRDKLTKGARAAMPAKLMGALMHEGKRTNGHPTKLDMLTVSVCIAEARRPLQFAEIKEALHVKNGNRLQPYLTRLRRDGYIKKTSKGFTSRRPYVVEA